MPPSSARFTSAALAASTSELRARRRTAAAPSAAAPSEAAPSEAAPSAAAQYKIGFSNTVSLLIAASEDLPVTIISQGVLGGKTE